MNNYENDRKFMNNDKQHEKLRKRRVPQAAPDKPRQPVQPEAAQDDPKHATRQRQTARDSQTATDKRRQSHTAQTVPTQALGPMTKMNTHQNRVHGPREDHPTLRTQMRIKSVFRSHSKTTQPSGSLRHCTSDASAKIRLKPFRQHASSTAPKLQKQGGGGVAKRYSINSR